MENQKNKRTLVCKDSVAAYKHKMADNKIIQDFCTNDKCTKTIATRLPPLRRPTQKDEEEWLIKDLPSDWVPVTKPSGVLDKIKKKREKEHEETIKELKNKREKVNSQIEMKIRLKANELKKELSEVKDNARQLLDALNLDENEILKLPHHIFDETTRHVWQLQEGMKKNVNEYYKFLQNLEKERSDEYKLILRETYKKLHMISHKLPYELQQFFEHEVLGINQIILANQRYYSDLHLQLILQIENDTRLWTQEIDSRKETWKYYYKSNALQHLNKEKLTLEPEHMFLSTESGKAASTNFASMGNNVEAVWTQIVKLPIRIEDVDLWSIVIQDRINNLDNAARDLVSLYKKAIVQVFNGYFDELHYLSKQMVEAGIANDQAEIEVLSKKLCQPVVAEIEKKYSIEIEELETLWNKVVKSLQESIQTTYGFLSESAHLWDLHFHRLDEARAIVLKDLSNTIEKNDKAGQVQETRLNMMIDLLRQEANEKKLEASQENVIEMLNSLKSTYNSHFNAEKKIIQKFAKLSESEVEILIAELQQFLSANPKEINVDPKCMRKRASQCSDKILTENLIPKQMQMCEYQVVAVHNWMFGLWEAIEQYKLTCKEEILDQASIWVDSNTRKVAKRLEIKLALHEPRYDRVKLDIFDVRLAELRIHSERLQRHKDGIVQEMAAVKEQHANCEKIYFEVVAKYKSSCDKILTRLDSANTVSMVQNCMHSFKTLNIECIKKIEQSRDSYENICLEKVNCIKESGLNFNKKISLFSEGGNYSYDEAKKTAKTLKKYEKIVKKKMKAIRKEINAKFKKATFQIQYRQFDVESRLNAIKGELEFNKFSNNKIKNIQNIITRNVFDIKLATNTIENNLNDLTKYALLEIGQLDFLDEFIDKSKSIVEQLIEFAKQLLLPEPMPFSNPTRIARKTQLKDGTSSSMRTSSTMTTKKGSRKSSKSRSSSGGESRSKSRIKNESKSKIKNKRKKVAFEDYGQLLYNRKPTKGGTFMSKICNYIFNSFMEIQDEAKEFYTEHEEIESRNKIPTTYEAFIEQILTKYQYYHLQCEIVWLEQVYGFIKLTDQFLDFLSQYSDKFLEKFSLISKATYQMEHENFVATTSAIQKANNKAFKTLHDKLKTLHGHPKNKHLLQALNEEMIHLQNELKDNVILIPAHREIQKTNALTYEEYLTKISNKLRVLIKRSTIELLNVKLIGQLENRLDFLEKIIEDEAPTEDDTLNEVELEVSKRLSIFNKKLKIPAEYRISLEHSKLLIENLVSDGFWNQNSLTLLNEFNYNDLTASKTNNLDSFLQYKLAQDYQTMSQTCTEEIDEIEDMANDDEIKWKNMWQSDNKKILNLYTVKYDFHTVSDN